MGNRTATVSVPMQRCTVQLTIGNQWKYTAVRNAIIIYYSSNFYCNASETKFQSTAVPTKIFYYFGFSASTHVKQAVLLIAFDEA